MGTTPSAEFLIKHLENVELGCNGVNDSAIIDSSVEVIASNASRLFDWQDNV